MKINVLCNSKTIFSLFVYIYIYSQNNTEKVDPERYALLAKKKKKKVLHAISKKLLKLDFLSLNDG